MICRSGGRACLAVVISEQARKPVHPVHRVAVTVFESIESTGRGKSLPDGLAKRHFRLPERSGELGAACAGWHGDMSSGAGWVPGVSVTNGATGADIAMGASTRISDE